MKTTLKIQNCYSWLLCENKTVMEELWKALKVRELGYVHSRLYKQRLWDGYTDFFKKETGRFLTGLLPEVLGALKLWKIEYETIDERNPITFTPGLVGPDFLHQWLTPEMPKFDLYDYQCDLINQVVKHHRGIICSSTGSGKTEIMIGILKKLPPNCPTLILANAKSLVEQNYERLKEWGFVNFGRLYDKYNEPNVITCATVQSLHKIEKLLPHFKVILTDEVHLLMSKGPKKWYNKMKGCSVRVAFSATWEKYGGKDKSQRYYVKGYFGPVLKTTSNMAIDGIVKTSKLQEKGTLSQSNCIFYTIRTPQLPFDTYIDAVTNGIANNWDLHEIVKKIVKKCEGRTLILVERIAHGDALHSLIPDSFWVSGEDSLETRKIVIERLQKSSSQRAVAIATKKIFDTGLNLHLHNLISVAGGKADHEIIQRMGRGLRPAGDKTELNYYDFIFEINDYLEKHSHMRIKILKKEGHKITIKETSEI